MISIIIPTLNEEKTIERTLKSLKALTDFDYEIIISDGKSTDKTIEISKKYGTKVIIYDGTIRQTISNGRNLGASIASGEFLVFIDADVIIPSINNFFKKTLTLFEKEEKLLGLSVSIRFFPELETWTDKFILSTFNYINFCWNNIFGIGGASGEFQMIRASAFKKLRGYNEKIVAAEDVEMFRRLALSGKTKIEMSLKILHPGRRAHKIGWPRLLWQWSLNGLSVLLFNHSFNSVWEEVR